MEALCADLQDECSELAVFVERLTPKGWETRTPFYGWTVWDEVAHLCHFDEAALLAATDPGAFEREARITQQRLAQGAQISALARERFGNLSGAHLLSTWRDRYQRLALTISRLAPKARLPWYGPAMSARSFATARMMEVWAHGQDVHDALCAHRTETSRLKHVAHIGVTTFGWSFVNRGLPVPEPAPWVELQAPGGETWSWGSPSEVDHVKGDAEEFCLVVTQRRNVADTSLECRGDGARRWLAIAQCFAGPPAEGPAPGARKIEFTVKR